jgi:hypothetical protein
MRSARALFARLGPHLFSRFAIFQKEADMSLPGLTTATVFLSTLWFAAALPAQTVASSSTSANVSKVRIVRLSQVKGEVRMDRAIGRGMEPAIANLPIVEQSKLQTGMGVAEVEFEDNSSVRLGPNSAVEFPRLERSASGTVSWMHVIKGTAYVSLFKSQGNQFTVLFGDQRLTLPPASHVRLDVGAKDAKLAVLDSGLHLQEQSGALDVQKKRTVTFSFADGAEPTVAKDVSEEPLDGWDKESVGYHQRLAIQAMNNSSFASGYSYGLSDLGYYGSFMDAGACGMMWRPYFASAAWDPYGNGAWAYYGGAGYSWVSPYPWGWTPYHYGSWSMCPGMGWGWQPGGAWNGLNNMAMVPLQRLGGGAGGHPLLPGRPPRAGEATMIPVNQRPLVRSELKSGDSFEFRKDSAGLGVPRGTMGRLDKLSNQAVSRGTATTQIYISAPSQNVRGGPANGASAVMLGASVHRGSAPPRMEDEASRSIMGGGSSARDGNAPVQPSAPARSTAAPSAPSRPSGGPASGAAGRPR